MTELITVLLGATVISYIAYRIGFKMGVLAAMARMNAVIIQMQDVVKDINDFQKQWTEDDL
jgi:ABC-type uncharacterized transport system permease subunit